MTGSPHNGEDGEPDPAGVPARRDTAPQEDTGRARGVRIEYRARVPRHMLGAALAEAFAIIDRETQQEELPPAAG